MGKTENLERALSEQAASLDPAQREFVLAQFEHYKWNEGRIAQLECDIEDGVRDPGTGFVDLDLEGKVFRQRHQLVAEQGVLFSHIMRWLKGTAAGKSELEEFIA